MNNMNYDLLKLSKILPSIKGKPILEIYQESLDRARQAQQQIQPEITNSNKYLLRPIGLHISEGDTPHNNLKKLGLTKSAQTLGRSNKIQDYSNLNVLLNEVRFDEEEEEYHEESSNHAKPKVVKMQTNTNTASSRGFTAATKESPLETSQQKSVGNSTLSNFVFSKKKRANGATPNTSNEYENVHQLYRMEGQKAFKQKHLTLNGKQVNVRGLNSEAQLNRPRRQIYNLQLDPMTNLSHQYISPNDSQTAHANTSMKMQESNSSWKQIFTAQTSSHKKLLLNQKVAAIPEPLNSTKSKPHGLVLDGTKLKALDSKRSQHYRSISSVKHASGMAAL